MLAHNPPAVERVVCGVGRSPTAANVFSVAAGLAERLRSRLALVHVPGHQFRVGADREALLEAGREHLARIADGHRIYEPIVQLGDPVSQLAATASEEDTLLVVGSRGRGLLRGAMLGSVSNQLTRAFSCPVVVVSPGSERGFGAGIGVDSPAVASAIDDSPVGELVLREAAMLTEQLGGRLVLIHVRPDSARLPVPAAGALPPSDPDAVDNVERTVGLDVLGRAMRQLSPGAPCEVHLGFGDVVACINEVAVQERAALVVVGSQARRSLRSALFGSVSKRLARAFPCPVCIVSPT
jgi:nucleotide-binding universal stress UspA family protein